MPPDLNVIAMEIEYIKKAQEAQAADMRSQFQEQAADLKGIRQLLDQKLERVEAKIDGYEFVRKDIYISESAARDKAQEKDHALIVFSISLSLTIVMAFVGYLVMVNR